MIAISTAWNSDRHAGWRPAVGELLGLGHPGVALDGAALHSDAADVRRLLTHEGGVLAALFAPAPRADPGPGRPLGLADPDAARRGVAIAQAVAAGVSAIKAGTARVVVRAGGVPDLDPGAEERFLRARLSGEADGALSLAGVDAPRDRFVDALCRSLHELSRLVPDARWLLETPRTRAQLPRPAELEAVFDELPRAPIGYWHDAGHAARLAALGVARQEDWLSVAARRAEGVSIADWSPLAERLPPGSGEVDWVSLRSQLGQSMLRVLVLDPALPAPMLADAVGEAASLGL